MDFLNSKRLLKVMWLPESDGIIFDMMNEKPLNKEESIYIELNKQINLKEWITDYSKEYKKWLEDKSDKIYDLNFSVNKNMIDAIKKLNQKNVKELLFYWFDVDRTDNENFKWEFCPIAGVKLLQLGNGFSKINNLISIEEYLVFPVDHK
jgi:hypothetical protein